MRATTILTQTNTHIMVILHVMVMITLKCYIYIMVMIALYPNHQVNSQLPLLGKVFIPLRNRSAGTCQFGSPNGSQSMLFSYG